MRTAVKALVRREVKRALLRRLGFAPSEWNVKIHSADDACAVFSVGGVRYRLDRATGAVGIGENRKVDGK